MLLDPFFSCPGRDSFFLGIAEASPPPTDPNVEANPRPVARASAPLPCPPCLEGFSTATPPASSVPLTYPNPPLAFFF